MFATGSLARRIERAEASLIEAGTLHAARRMPEGQAFATPLRGGIAAFAEAGSPLNKVAGLGFGGVPHEDELEAVEGAYAARACPVHVELSSFAEPAIGRLLTRRGYELIGYENVSGLALEAGSTYEESPVDGLTIARVGAAEADDWLRTVLTGFKHPDIFDGLASHESFEDDVVERSIEDMVSVDGFERYVAYRSGIAAGGASFRASEGVAQLCGSATLPEHRRRGVQTALLRNRLAEAARRGCDVAVVTTQPGSKSQENIERFGFTLLYVRAILAMGRRALTEGR
jgi:ribosomal protein S18 acetylase RimI-like enzyme